MDRDQVGDIIEQMREARRAVRGDGFSKAGALISSYKRVIQAMEKLQEAYGLPDDPVEACTWRKNPNCFGLGSDSVESCECKAIFEKFSACSQLVKRTPD